MNLNTIKNICKFGGIGGSIVGTYYGIKTARCNKKLHNHNNVHHSIDIVFSSLVYGSIGGLCGTIFPISIPIGIYLKSKLE